MSQETFDRAVLALSEKRPEEARKILLELRQSGVNSADLESNLATASIQSGESGWALYHARQALHLNRWNLDRWSELRKIQSRVEQDGASSLSPATSTWQLASTAVRGEEAVFLGLNFGLVLGFLWISKKLRPALAMALGFPALLFLLYGGYVSAGLNVGIVPKAGPLRPSPLESASPSADLRAGSEFEILRSSGDFIEVQNSRFKGWVREDQIVKLP
jgi:hypothetical protein